MAALNCRRKLHPFANRKKRRRRRLKSLRLLRGNVEVRSKEEGFLGSWQKGTVISRKRMCFTAKFHVKYDHLLLDDSSDHVVESVNVYLVASKTKRSCINNTTRGYIRPFPPPVIDLNKWGLPFGLCVDVNHNEGWWEGVIFDYEDGSEERNVFFPDLGDEMVAPLSALRITQDWDEESEEWTRRGTWLFLEAVEEVVEKSGYQIPVSIKQLWYDLQEGGMVKDWTCSSRAVWEELVSKVICGNLGLVLDRVFDEIRVPQGVAKLMEIAESVNLSSEEESALVVVKSSPEGSQCLVNCNGGSTRFSKNRIYNLLPAKLDRLYRPKCCPEAVVEYAKLGKGGDLATAAKQHLLYLKWSVKFYKDPIGRLRTRYISPTGKCYDSLPNACRGLIKSEAKNPPLALEPVMVATSETSDEEAPQSKYPVKSNRLSVISSLNRKAAVSRNGVSRVHELLPAGRDIVNGAKFCPEAIVGYAQGGASRDLSASVKQHLLYLGWSIKFYLDAAGVKRVRYISPSGKCYDSLPNVCRDLVKSEGKYLHLVTTNDEQTIMKRKRPNCLKAIMDCYKVSRREGGKKDGRMITNAQDHLVAMGWIVKVIIRNGKFGWLYKSPKGRIYTSLRKACKRCMDERDKSVASKTGRRFRGGQKERTRKTKTCEANNSLTLLSWLIDNGGVSPRAKVYFHTSKDDSTVRAEGKVTREGIKCKCCQKVFSLSSFELHVGRKRSRKSSLGPASSIFLADGRSLLDCQVQVIRGKLRSLGLGARAKRLKVRHEGENDDVCSVCRSGGNLILCDQCPSSFHGSCLGMKDVPRGDWFCPSCCCRICKRNKCESSVDEGIHKCTQCEYRYHITCLRNNGVDNLDLDHGVNWFCGNKCRKIYASLAALVGLPIPVGIDGLTWTLLKNVEYDDKESVVSGIEAAEAQSYMKREIALQVMHECFEPLEEFCTGRDIVNDVIFSTRSELRRLDFRGFYTVLLEKDDEVFCVATLRIFGETAAEIPLVATRHKYRRLGMCRILMNAIEKKLTELGVERLVLPSIPTVLNTWTGSFGFSKMTDSERLQSADSFFLNFPGAILCHKLLTCTKSNPQLKAKTDEDEEMEVELDGSSSLGSEVVQADETEQHHSKIGDDNISIPEDTHVHAEPLIPGEEECSLEISSSVGPMKKGNGGGCGLLKYYRRRKISRMKI
ncbi:Increased DNA methylation 1 [Linum grandiflorum]